MPAISGRTYSGVVHIGHLEAHLRLTATILTLAFLVLAVACSGDGASSNGDGGGVTVTPLTRTPDSASTATSGATPEPTLPASNGEILQGFVFPIEGGCLPKGDQLMPNAPRNYRQGIHEGIDFYGVDNCTSIGVDTPVRAVKAGRVVRADTNYQSPTPQEMSALLADPRTEASLDGFRGRQVWVDHGGGVVTRYCHLNGVAPGLTVGQSVNAGDVIAYVGESGTPESVNNPGNGYHLHFEVRVGSSYLGAGEPALAVRQTYTALFTR